MTVAEEWKPDNIESVGRGYSSSRFSMEHVVSIYDPCGRIALLIVPLNYEERYLTVVAQENTLNNYLDSSRPQTSASSAPTYSEKFLVDNKKQAEIHVYPEVAGKVVPLKTPYPNAVAHNQEQGAFLPLAPHRRYCRMSKKAFLIVLGVVAIAVVRVAAGAIGASLGSRKSPKDTITSLLRVLVHSKSLLPQHSSVNDPESWIVFGLSKAFTDLWIGVKAA